MSRLALVTLVVDNYDIAIDWLTRALRFTLTEDSPALTDDGRPKRWVVMTPSGGGCGLLIARADGPVQSAQIGCHAGGRVAFFLESDDFAADHAHLRAEGVIFEHEPRHTDYGTVVKFRDLWGNRWHLWSRR